MELREEVQRSVQLLIAEVLVQRQWKIPQLVAALREAGAEVSTHKLYRFMRGALTQIDFDTVVGLAKLSGRDLNVLAGLENPRSASEQLASRLEQIELKLDRAIATRSNEELARIFDVYSTLLADEIAGGTSAAAVASGVAENPVLRGQQLAYRYRQLWRTAVEKYDSGMAPLPPGTYPGPSGSPASG